MDSLSFNLDSWNRGDWVECSLVESYFDMSFHDCFLEFEFSRQVVWNKAPLNGQKVVTCFRKVVE